MSQQPQSRRDFHQLTLAALGGALAGFSLGCSSEPDKTVKAPDAKSGKAGDEHGHEHGHDHDHDHTEAAAGEPDLKLLLAEKHVCRGLNTCKGKGGCGATKGTNECAGQGNCATVEHHGCGGDHDCKGLSGCGDTAGINACKGKGGCSVPLMEGAWKKARANFEKVMATENKPVGEAPPAKAK